MFMNRRKSEPFLLEYFQNSTNQNLTSIADLASLLSTKNLFNEIYTLKQYMFTLEPELRKSFGFNFSEVFIYCRFGNDRCDPTNFEWFWDSDYGNCYRINSGRSNFGDEPIKVVYDTGIGKGLSLILIDTLENNDFIRMSNIEKTTGINIVIYNQSNFQLSHYQDSLKLKAGMCANIKLKKVISETLPTPYSNCQNHFDSNLFNEMNCQNKSYSQKYCIELCKQNYIFQRCNCYSPFLPNIRFKKMCITLNDYKCSYEFFKDISRNIRSDCYKMCPIECTDVNYDLFIYTEDFPSLGYYEQLKKNEIIQNLFSSSNLSLNFSSLKASMVGLNIFYDELSYAEISESHSYHLSRTLEELLVSWLFFDALFIIIIINFYNLFFHYQVYS